MGNIERGLRTTWACGVSAMTEGNIPNTYRKISYYCLYCPDILKKLTKEEVIYRKILTGRHRFLSQWKCSINCTNFSIMATGQQLFLIQNQSLFWKIRACGRHNETNARKYTKRTQFRVFPTPHFSKYVKKIPRESNIPQNIGPSPRISKSMKMQH